MDSMKSSKLIATIWIGIFKKQKINYIRVDKDTKVSENFEQSTIICSNLPNLVDLILKKRSRENSESLLIRVGMDGRGGFLNICMSIFDIDEPVSANKTSLSKMFKDPSVKKVFLIAVVLDVPQNYVNVKKLWIN